MTGEALANLLVPFVAQQAEGQIAYLSTPAITRAVESGLPLSVTE